MVRFYTIKDLYETKIIDDNFIDTFNKLDFKVQNIVMGKNLALRRFLEKNRIQEYEEIDFSNHVLRLKKIVILENTGQEDVCPICGKPIKKKNVTVKVGKKTKGFLIYACGTCKKLYSNNIDESKNVLSRAQVEYEVITNEEWKNGTEE